MKIAFLSPREDTVANIFGHLRRACMGVSLQQQKEYQHRRDNVLFSHGFFLHVFIFLNLHLLCGICMSNTLRCQSVDVLFVNPWLSPSSPLSGTASSTINVHVIVSEWACITELPIRSVLNGEKYLLITRGIILQRGVAAVP